MIRSILIILIITVLGPSLYSQVHVKSLQERTSLAGEWKILLSDDVKFARPDYDDSAWDSVIAPGSMMNYTVKKNGAITGILWLRKTIFIDRSVSKQDLGLILGKIGNADETYFNGKKIGGTGSFPPREFSMWYHPRYYTVPESLIRYGEKNVIAVRIWFYLFNEMEGNLAVTGMDDWQISKTRNNFLQIIFNYIIIAMGMPILLIFFFIYVRRRLSQEYLFYCLQLLCGIVIILELCNFWNIYTNSLVRYLALGLGWGVLNVMHPLFLHRIYGLKRKKIELLLYLNMIVDIVFAAFFVSPGNLRLVGIIFISITICIGFYNFSCHISALYKKRPYAKLFGFFGSAVVVAAIHDGFIYLSKFIGVRTGLGIMSEYMLFPYGAVLLYVGTALVLVSRFIRMMDEIQDMNVNLENKVRERTEELQKARDALWGEMELAKKIQTVLLPRKPAIDGYEITAYMQPADLVGGDYYDIINAGGRNWLVIGDVSGHGFSAGLIMMMFQTSIHTIVRNYPDVKPSELLSKVNTALRYNITQMSEDKFMSMTVFAVFQNGTMHFSGLHQDIMIFRKTQGSVEVVSTNGIYLGIEDDIGHKMTDTGLKLDTGDCLLVYSDGITEAWRTGSVRNRRNPDTDMYGDERLRNVFEALGGRSLEDIKRGILESLIEYELCDDLTFIVLKKLPEPVKNIL